VYLLLECLLQLLVLFHENLAKKKLGQHALYVQKDIVVVKHENFESGYSVLQSAYVSFQSAEVFLTVVA